MKRPPGTTSRITPEMGEACLRVMRRVADGGAFDPSYAPYDAASESLHYLGWLQRDPQDYFDYTDGCQNCGSTYRPDQVLMALALCVTLAADAAVKGSHGRYRLSCGKIGVVNSKE